MGIGSAGRTLKEMLEERDRLFRETSRLWGLNELRLHREDPAKVMRFQSRMVGTCITSRELAKLTAASPIVRTVGECLFMALVPEGDVVAASLGLVGHVGAAPLQVGNMIRIGYEDNPGIRPGDIFANNDPHYGSSHAADNFVFIPVFHEGELVAWACAMNHVMDVGGALAPGSVPSLSPNIFTDGFLYQLVKIGENFNSFRWFDMMWERRTRQPLLNVIDSRMRVTGAKLLHDKLLEVIREFGVDYFREVTKEILERERQRAVIFFKERTVPGTYEDIFCGYLNTQEGRMSPLFPEADRSWQLVYRSQMHIQSNGSVLIDFAGSNSQDHFNQNAREGWIKVGLCYWWVPLVMYGGVLNSSIYYAVETKAPKGTVFNPDNDHLSCTLGNPAARVTTNLIRSQSRAMYSRGIVEEALVKELGQGMLEQDGVFDNGVPWGFSYFGLISAESTGARPYKDGDALSACVINSQSDAGEDEEWEMYMPPFMVLGKTFLRDGCGHGKYRGGSGIQLVLLVVSPGRKVRQAAIGSGGFTTVGGSGLSGGYPGLGSYNVLFHDTNMRKLIDAGEGYPSTLPEIYRWMENGKLRVGTIQVFSCEVPPISLKDGDLYVQVASVAGGWGDPLDRDLSLIEKDLNEGWMSAEASGRVYGAVVERVDGKWRVNSEATTKARLEMRRKRKKRAMSGRKWWSRERERVVNKEFPALACSLYRDVLKYDNFRQKFVSTWQLPTDYQM